MKKYTLLLLILMVGCVNEKGVNNNSISVGTSEEFLEALHDEAVNEIVMQEGRYGLPETFISRSLTIRGQGEVIIYGTQLQSNGIARSFFIRAPATIENINFDTENRYRVDAFANNIAIRNCTFSGVQPKFGAIHAGGNDMIIEDVKIDITSGGNTLDHGIYVKSGSRLIFRNVQISGPSGYGFQFYTTEGLIDDVLLENCVAENSRMRSGFVMQGKGAGRVGEVTVSNSQFNNNTEFGMIVRSGNLTLAGNTATGNNLVPILCQGGQVSYENNSFSCEGGEPPPNGEPPGDEEPPVSELRKLIISGHKMQLGEKIFIADSVIIHFRERS